MKMMRREAKEIGKSSETYNYLLRQIGNPKTEKERLDAASPELHADEIDIPVLLIYGKQDGIVPFEESKRMYKALKKAGKNVAYIELPDSYHSWRPPEDREIEVRETLAFLSKYLPIE